MKEENKVIRVMNQEQTKQTANDNYEQFHIGRN